MTPPLTVLVISLAGTPEPALEQLVGLELSEGRVRWLRPSPRIFATASLVLS